jgi:hypothetical protein
MKNVRHPWSVMKRISGASVSVVVMLVETHGVASVWRKNDKE